MHLLRGLGNPLTATRDDNDRLRLRALLRGLNTCRRSSFLAPRSHLHGCPERFFNRVIHRLILEWLKSRDGRQRERLRSYLSNMGVELSMAMLFLRQINSEDWHDGLLTEAADLLALRFIDKALHSVHLRLVEEVLAPLIRPVARFARLDRGKKTECPDVFNLVEELSSSSMSACVEAYHHTMRNGIAHGGITYRHNAICYRDNKGNAETIGIWAIVRLCDDLGDACSALASAIKAFLITALEHGYRLPRELLVEELVEETRTPWWAIGGCSDNELPSETQLLIYARPESRGQRKTWWWAVQSAALAESFAPGHARYFTSLRGSRSWPGWAEFDGIRLKHLRESRARGVHEYTAAFADPGFCYTSRLPLRRLLGWFDTLLKAFRLYWPLVWRQIREIVQYAVTIARDASMYRDGWGYVLSGAVVMPELTKESAASTVRANRRYVIRKAAGAARSSVSANQLLRYLALGYARACVSSDDFRCRRLGNFGPGRSLSARSSCSGFIVSSRQIPLGVQWGSSATGASPGMPHGSSLASVLRAPWGRCLSSRRIGLTRYACRSPASSQQHRG